MTDGRIGGAYHHVRGLFGSWPGLRLPFRRSATGLAKPSGILKPFGKAERRWYKPGPSWLLVSLLLLFCLIYGFAFAILAPYIVVPFAIPILVVLLLIIWAMPDAAAPARMLNFFFFSFFIGLVIWPNYLSISLPGLPWISVIRLTVFPMTLLLLYCVSVSQEFRDKLGNVVSSIPYLWQAITAMAVIYTVSVGFSAEPVNSLSKLVVVQTQWTAIFFVACYVFLKPGRAMKWAACIWIMAVWVSAVGILEGRLGYVPWRSHIPAIFQINDPVVQRYLAGGQRSATGIHRVQSIFTISLSFAEYLCLSLPFAMHFMRSEFRWIVRAIAAMTIPLTLYAIILADARLGFVGFLITIMALIFIWTYRRRQANKNNPLWTGIIVAYPVFFCLMVAATFFVGRLRARVWGNGPQQFSTQSRIEQMHLGIPKILSHPWGYGLTQANDTLGFVDVGGFATIDSYYLTAGLEYGILGFLIYFGTLLVAIYFAGKRSLSSGPLEGEYALLIPASVTLLNFVVIKSVYSQQDNHPIVFMVLGMIAALLWRVQKESGGPSPKSQTCAVK